MDYRSNSNNCRMDVSIDRRLNDFEERRIMSLIDSNTKFIAFCKNEIVDHFNKHADKMAEKITENDICVVWYFGMLNNYKALFKITTSNQYYEMTYDKNENRFYKDVYKKCESESEPVKIIQKIQNIHFQTSPLDLYDLTVSCKFVVFKSHVVIVLFLSFV